jgi:uncharacterized membrane protein
MSHLSQNLERLIQMISIEQLLGLVKQNNTSSDILTTPIVQKVVKAYEDELQTLNTVTNQNACVKDYSEDIAKIHEQLAAINSNLLHLADVIKNIHISTNVDKSSSKAEETNEDKSLEDKSLEVVANEDKSSVASLEVVASLEEEHVRLKIEEKQVTTVNESDDESSLASLEEEEVASLEAEEEEEEVEESEKEISDDEVEEEEVADASSVEEESVATVASLEEVESVADEEEESEKEISDEESEEEAKNSNAVVEEEDEEEVFEIEIDDVTYYATSEENGILYEVDADGEVGKKVGIIKDGEPIFS